MAVSILGTTLILLAGPLQPTATPPPSCRNVEGHVTLFAIHAQFFADHSQTSWMVSIDAKGRMKVMTGEGVRQLRVKEETVNELIETVNAQNIWSWSPTRGTPSQTGFLRLDVCSAGRTHSIMSYGHTDGDAVTTEDIQFVRLMVRLRRLFNSKLAEDLEMAEEYLNRLRKEPKPQ